MSLKLIRNILFVSIFGVIFFILAEISTVAANSSALSFNGPTAVSCANFSTLPPGASVKGLGTVHPNLNITGFGNIAAIAEGQSPAAYGSSGGSNAGLGVLGGFSDFAKIHEYEFLFAPDISVSYFSVRMLDFGDLNTVLATEHSVSLQAYDSNGLLIATSDLVFTSDASANPSTGSAGDLRITGDAAAERGKPGNFVFSVYGSGITRLVIKFSNNISETASDPNHGFADLCFDVEDSFDFPESTQCVDFNEVAPGSSVEGLGVVNQYLNISSPNGNTVALAEGTPPAAYGSPGGINFGMDPLGGFANAAKEHRYTFSFSPEVSVNFFTVRTLDFGDLNLIRATDHKVTLEAYNSSGFLVSSSQLSFVTDAVFNPESSSAGNLQITGDATASIGNPGNYLFAVSGEDIVRLEMKYSTNLGEGASDPNHGLAVLCFVPEDDTPPPPTDIPLSCEDIGHQTIAEEPWLLHVINRMRPTTLDFARPAGADYAIINTGWEWTGHPNQFQVTEMHTVETPFGSTTSEDYGNEELTGQVLWFDVLQGYYNQASLPVTIDYAGDGSDPGSHYSHGLVVWCSTGDGSGSVPPQLDPPTAELTLLSLKTSPEVSGKFRVEYACSQAAPNLVAATLNKYDVVDDQELNLVIRDRESARIVGGALLWLYAPEFSLDVTCADDSGNEVSTSVAPEFVSP